MRPQRGFPTAKGVGDVVPAGVGVGSAVAFPFPLEEAWLFAVFEINFPSVSEEVQPKLRPIKAPNIPTFRTIKFLYIYALSQRDIGAIHVPLTGRSVTLG